MNPRFTIDNSFDLRTREVKRFSEFVDSHAGSKRADFNNLYFGNLRLSVPLTPLHRSVFSLVVGVFLACSPFKIRDAVIDRVSVLVARFVSFWARTAERLKHKSVYEFSFVSAVYSKCYLLVLGARRLDYRSFAFAPLAFAKAGPYGAIGKYGIAWIRRTAAKVRGYFRHKYTAITVNRDSQQKYAGGARG